MKKICIILMIFSPFFVLCGSKKKEKKKKEYVYKRPMVRSDFVKYVVNKPFISINVEEQKAKSVLNKYFGHNKYKVIWNEKLGYKNKIVYFAVEEYSPKTMYKTITKAIAVREDGKIMAYFEPEKGIYTPTKKIIDFKRIGFKRGEVKYFVLRINKSKIIGICLLDKNFNNIGGYYTRNTPASNPFTVIVTNGETREGKKIFEYINFDTGLEKEEEFYKEMNRILNIYRKKMRQGIKIKSAAVKVEFERLKKANLVKGL